MSQEKYVYMAFDRFAAVALFESAGDAMHFIESETEFALDFGIYKDRVERLQAGYTVYANTANTRHEIRAVRAYVRPTINPRKGK